MYDLFATFELLGTYELPRLVDTTYFILLSRTLMSSTYRYFLGNNVGIKVVAQKFVLSYFQELKKANSIHLRLLNQNDSFCSML